MADAAKPVKERPLSPHLQIYKWEITMFLSILHRATGAGLALGCVIFTVWLLTTIKGGDNFTLFYTFAKTPVGILVFFFTLFAYVFHMLNGIRHMVWDTGAAFGRKSAHLGGWLVFFASFALTVVLWNCAKGG